MFGTIIMDSYKSDEAESMSRSIDEICSPLDGFGWSSAGIYSFWNYKTKEILYIGLAVDLCTRFKQHNGILPISENSCKVRQIEEYFSDNERLGYTILVQSPMFQPIVQRNEKCYQGIQDISNSDYAGGEAVEYIRQAEGQLIESYRQVKGSVPPWNKIGGDVFSRKYASRDNYEYVIRAFSSGTANNHLVSRSTIRELAKDSTLEFYETRLHGLRMLMINHKMSFEEAVAVQIKTNPYFAKQWECIVNSKYLDKELVL